MYKPSVTEFLENEKANSIRDVCMQLIIALELQNTDEVDTYSSRLEALGVQKRQWEGETISDIVKFAEWIGGQILFLVDKTKLHHCPSNREIILFTQEFGTPLEEAGTYKLEHLSEGMKNYLMMRKAAFQLRHVLLMP